MYKFGYKIHFPDTSMIQQVPTCMWTQIQVSRYVQDFFLGVQTSNLNVQKLLPFKTKRNETEQKNKFEHNYYWRKMCMYL